MDKQDAMRLLGGSAASMAEEIGVTVQAINAWPETLTAKTRDRVQAALWRRAQGIPLPVKEAVAAEAG